MAKPPPKKKLPPKGGAGAKGSQAAKAPAKKAAPAKVDPKTGKPVPPAGAEAQAPPWAKKKKK